MLSAEWLTITSGSHAMARTAASTAQSIAKRRAINDDWDFDPLSDDDPGPSWIKDYRNGVKSRSYAASNSSPLLSQPA
jgi:hypothetical protein